MHKWIGAALQMSAAGMLVVAGAEGSFAVLIPGIITGIAGLWAWDQGSAKAIAPPQPVPDRAVAEMERLQQVLSAMQDDVAKLGEDRDFYRQLYSGSKSEQPAPPIHDR